MIIPWEPNLFLYILGRRRDYTQSNKYRFVIFIENIVQPESKDSVNSPITLSLNWAK